MACTRCGVIAGDHGRREHHLADAPAIATEVQLIWRKRRRRCREPRCPTGVWSEEHPALPTRSKLTTRAARLAGVDTLGVDEHIWRPSTRHRDRAVTSIVDLTRDEQGQVHT